MSALDVLLTPPLLKAAYDDVSRRFGARGGFFALDAVEGFGAWVHVRRHVHDARSAPGIRIIRESDVAEGMRTALAARQYAIVTVMTAGKLPSEEVLELFEMAYTAAGRWLNVEVDANGVMVRVDAAGERSILVPADRNIEVRLVKTHILDHHTVEVLPVIAEVRSNRDRIYLPVRSTAVKRPRDQYFKITRQAAGALGSFSLDVDVELRSMSPDLLIVRSKDETIAIEMVDRIPRQESGPVHLHVVFDRTTIDVESWAIAIAAASPKADDVLTASTTPSDDDYPGAWNRRIRSAVAEAIPAAVAEMQHRVTVTLWTFSDRSREGIGASPIGGADGRPWDRIGELTESSLFQRAVVEGPDCEWRPGLDHVDAVDEVLKEVYEYSILPTNLDMQHVVLIIGDSPPPPADVHDPIWQYVVAAPFKTNSRRSTLFRDTMAAFRAAGVPVGWVFLNWPLPPTGAQFQLYHEPYNDVRLLRQKTIDALRLFPGLEVQVSLGLDQLKSTAQSILTRIVADAPQVIFRGPAYALS